MKEIVWKGLRKEIKTMLRGIALSLKTRLLRNANDSTVKAYLTPKEMAGTKLSPLLGEMKKHQLMGEANRSIGIEYWMRERKYQPL